MCLGALVDAGVPLEYLRTQLKRLGMAEEYHLRAEFVQRNGQQATKVEVELLSQPNHSHSGSHLPAHHQNHGQGQDGDHSGGNRHDGTAQAEHRHDHHDHRHDSGHDPRHDQGSHQPHSHSHGHDHSYSEHSHHPKELGSEPIDRQKLGRQTGNTAVAKGGEQPASGLPGHAHSHSHSRHLPEIAALILAAGLPERVTQWSLAVFRRLAEAEGAVHGIPPEQVHFHEVGATDAIVDIVGTCLGLDYLNIERLYCSALPIGGGTVWAAHGRLPVPPPAVLKLWELRQVPLYSNGIDKELVTPTGAALVTVLACEFGPPPPLLLQKVGLGAGSKDLSIPNILRLWIGETTGAGSASPTQQGLHPLHASAEVQTLSSSATQIGPGPGSQLAVEGPALETVMVLETQIDDLSPQAIGYVMTVLLSAGALDVFTQSVGMKKSRSGLLLAVICRPDQVDQCEAILFRETTTLGIRRSQQQRTALNRWFEQVDTAHGPVRVKVAGWTRDAITNVQPEYEDCVQLAQQHQIAWREVHRLALQAWYEQAQQLD
ncbi:MAG: nickel pincer cofactor biosynthesis protein LarC [Elainella sp.]